MLPIISLGLKVGMGAIAGHKLVMRQMRPKPKTLGQLPPINVVGFGDIRVAINYANGLHYAQTAQMFLNRGDLQNAIGNIQAAYKAAGASLEAVGRIYTAPVAQRWINNYLIQYNARKTVNRWAPILGLGAR